ncbi:MAG: hypothetical protein IT426_19945 [Pirellulales bacterium]|nr:hypothetical protein [Pirellulales bacterium]
MPLPRLSFPIALCAGLLLAAGCGDGRPKRVPVSGRVTIDGKPLEYGFVQVMPKGNRPASGQLDSQGRFSLTTFDDRDGCVLGKHPVVVIPNKSLNATTMKWFAPKKYGDQSTSGLQLEVTGSRDDVEFKLTWEGSGHAKPFIEKSAAGEGDEPRR